MINFEFALKLNMETLKFVHLFNMNSNVALISSKSLELTV